MLFAAASEGNHVSTRALGSVPSPGSTLRRAHQWTCNRQWQSQSLPRTETVPAVRIDPFGRIATAVASAGPEKLVKTMPSPPKVVSSAPLAVRRTVMNTPSAAPTTTMRLDESVAAARTLIPSKSSDPFGKFCIECAVPLEPIRVDILARRFVGPDGQQTEHTARHDEPTSTGWMTWRPPSMNRET